MGTHIINVEEARDLEDEIVRPGRPEGGGGRDASRKSTRFLGQRDDDPTSPERAP